MIGIAVTTYNRNEITKVTLSNIKKFLPEGAKLIVVDDGSDKPFPNADYTFKENVGTPIAKNKCLELLYDAGCNHIFLFDNDCYPVVENWHIPYIESPENHLNYTFKYDYEEKKGHKVHSSPNGCMMYFNKKVIDVVGGIDLGFKKYGHWHGAYSNRIHNAGLTSFPFMDVIDSYNLFYSMDEWEGIQTSRNDIGKYLSINKKRYFETIKSKEYHPIKNTMKIHYSNPFSIEKNIGKALNEFCEMVPDGDWICLQDGDMMYLTPDWGKQIAEVVTNYGNKYSLIGCLTNRLGRPIQVYDKANYNNHDIKFHYDLAVKLANDNWGVVDDITHKKYVAGMFMLFPKSIWLKNRFKENVSYFDDEFSKGVLRQGGKVGLMKGLYVYHSYRIWSDTPRTSKDHLSLL